MGAAARETASHFEDVSDSRCDALVEKQFGKGATTVTAACSRDDIVQIDLVVAQVRAKQVDYYFVGIANERLNRRGCVAEGMSPLGGNQYPKRRIGTRWHPQLSGPTVPGGRIPASSGAPMPADRRDRHLCVFAVASGSLIWARNPPC
jgi:hypothetical protein